MYPIIVACLSVAVLAYVIAMSTTVTGARYFAMMIMPIACTGPQIMLYKTVNLHMARPFPKRAAGVAMLNAIGGLSNIWASYLYFAPPRYFAAFATGKLCLKFASKESPLTNISVLGCAVAFFLTITGYLIHVRRMNKLLGGTPDEQRRAMKGGVTQQQVNMGWRYIGF